MSHNKLPPEIHLVQGTKGMNQGILIPEKLRARIPYAEWADKPEEFSKQEFVNETADYLYEVYGIGTKQDRHTLKFLADQLKIYIDASTEQEKHPLVIKINGGKTFSPNPYIAIANRAMENSIKIMGELGLTPQSRLANGKAEGESNFTNLLRGAGR